MRLGVDDTREVVLLLSVIAGAAGVPRTLVILGYCPSLLGVEKLLCAGYFGVSSAVLKLIEKI